MAVGWGRIERRPGYRLWIGGPVPPGADAWTLGSLVIVRTRHAASVHLLAHELELRARAIEEEAAVNESLLTRGALAAEGYDRALQRIFAVGMQLHGAARREPESGFAARSPEVGAENAPPVRASSCWVSGFLAVLTMRRGRWDRKARRYSRRSRR